MHASSQASFLLPFFAVPEQKKVGLPSSSSCSTPLVSHFLLFRVSCLKSEVIGRVIKNDE